MTWPLLPGASAHQLDLSCQVDPHELSTNAMARSKASTPAKSSGTKREREEDDVGYANGDKIEDQQPVVKQAKTEDSTTGEPSRGSRSKSNKQSIDKAKLDSIMDAYGVLPLQDTELGGPTQATPETILALVYLTMLTSARINYELAYKSLQCLIEAGYHDLTTLPKSIWKERTEVLTKGGYTRYREKTATALGELAEFVRQKYGLLVEQYRQLENRLEICFRTFLR